MRTDQGEAILMLFDVPNRDLPPLDRVAVFALRSQLPAMDVGVAIGAAVAHLGKNKVRVTLRAKQLGVRPREGENGKLRMIEAHSNPAIHGVALLAICREA